MGVLQDALERSYDPCFAALVEACDSFCDNVVASIGALRTLADEARDLPEDVRKAAVSMVAGLEDYLSARREMAKLTWSEGLLRERRSFADCLNAEIQQGMKPIYQEVLSASGPKVQIQRTKVMSEKLSMQASSILQEAINRMQSRIMAACGTQKGGLAASLAAGMLNGSQDKITGELQLFFDTKVQGSKD